MTISLIFILLVLALTFLFINRIKAATIIMVITLISLLFIGNGVIPGIMLKHLQINYVAVDKPQWKNKNAIVLLGAGTVKHPLTNVIHPTIMAYSRINEAAHLYHKCIKENGNCSIIISGGDVLKTGISEALNYKNELLDLNVNNADIVLESHSVNTYRNAEFSSAILNENHYDNVFLVTSGIHLKRSLLYFSHFGIQAQPALADYLTPQYAILPTGYNFAMTDFAIHEYLGMARYHVYNFMGMNKRTNVL